MTHTEPARCRRCGRPLRTPAAVAAQYGPGCALQVLHEAAQGRHNTPATAKEGN